MGAYSIVLMFCARGLGLRRVGYFGHVHEAEKEERQGLSPTSRPEACVVSPT